jgi:hypothetical protein
MRLCEIADHEIADNHPARETVLRKSAIAVSNGWRPAGALARLALIPVFAPGNIYLSFHINRKLHFGSQ